MLELKQMMADAFVYELKRLLVGGGTFLALVAIGVAVMLISWKIVEAIRS